MFHTAKMAEETVIYTVSLVDELILGGNGDKVLKGYTPLAGGHLLRKDMQRRTFQKPEASAMRHRYGSPEHRATMVEHWNSRPDARCAEWCPQCDIAAGRYGEPVYDGDRSQCEGEDGHEGDHYHMTDRGRLFTWENE